MLKTIELALEKECGLQPGANFHLVKISGKKLTVEVKEGTTREVSPTKTDTVWGMFADIPQVIDQIVMEAKKSNEQE